MRQQPLIRRGNRCHDRSPYTVQSTDMRGPDRGMGAAEGKKAGQRDIDSSQRALRSRVRLGQTS